MLLAKKKEQKKTWYARKSGQYFPFLQKRPFVHNSVCSQIFGGFVCNIGWVFAILFEALLIEIQEEIHHFPGWEGGGYGAHFCEQKFCETNWHFLKRLFKEMPLHFILIGPFARKLFSWTLLPWSSTCKGSQTPRLVEDSWVPNFGGLLLEQTGVSYPWQPIPP